MASGGNLDDVLRFWGVFGASRVGTSSARSSSRPSYDRASIVRTHPFLVFRDAGSGDLIFPPLMAPLSSSRPIIAELLTYHKTSESEFEENSAEFFNSIGRFKTQADAETPYPGKDYCRGIDACVYSAHLGTMIKPFLISLALSLSAGMLPNAAAAQAPHETGTDTMPDAVTQIRANLDSWLAAFNAKDIDALMALYDPESSYANANAPYRTTLEDIREGFAAGFSALNATLQFKEETAVAGSDMGLLVGKYYFAPPQGETSPGPTGRVALVYRKQADGSWKLLFDMDNAPPDVSPADFQ